MCGVFYALQSGQLLLSGLIRFPVKCALFKMKDVCPLVSQLVRHTAVIHALLARKPLPLMAQHAEELSALTLLCSLIHPHSASATSIGWARALI